MEQVPLQPTGDTPEIFSATENKSPLEVVFRAPLENESVKEITQGMPVTYQGKIYAVEEIYPDMKSGEEVLRYYLKDGYGQPPQKDGIGIYLTRDQFELL